MKSAKPIDVPATVEKTEAVVVRQPQAVGQALTASQITERLKFIKQVMQENMTVGVDYGKVPGCGDKPGLFQPGAQKLSMTFQLNPEVREETINEYQNYHRGYRLLVRVSNGNKFADGVGECSTLESKYRYRQGSRECPDCKKPAIIKGQAQYGGGWVCYKKKGGCGAKWKDGTSMAEMFANATTVKEENDNPADCWNTVRKMAFKRAFVHAIINATNTSELWSQDLEDLHANQQTVTRRVEPTEAEEYGFVDDGDHDLGPQKDSARRGRQAPEPKGTAGQTGAVSGAGENEAAAFKRGTSSPPGNSVFPTSKHRDRMVVRLIEMFGDQNHIREFAEKAGIILETETLLDWPLRFVPVTLEQMDAVEKAMARFFDGEEAVKPFVNPDPPAEKPQPKIKGVKSAKEIIEVPRDEDCDPDSPQARWRAFPVPFGKHAGVTLGKLDKNVLYGFWAGFECKPTFPGRDGNEVRKKPEALVKDKLFRKMLDQSGQHYQFTKKEE